MRNTSLKLALLFATLSASSLTLYCQESLLIGPGDTLSVKVFDTPQMDQQPKVTDSGEIPMMFIGNIKVAGLTPAQAAHEIERSLQEQKYMLHPQVTVSVASYSTQDVSILGQVKDAGTYDIDTAMPVLKVLSLAGGITEMGDRHITIQRHSGSQEKVSYYISNDSTKAIDNQVLVYPGDLVIVPRVGIVYVSGDVGRPGGFPISNSDSEMTVLQALALAGAANKSAVVSKARLLRKSPQGITDVPIQLSKIEKGEAPDIKMEANDVLFIPSSFLRNMAMNGSQIAAAATSSLIYLH